MISINTTLKTKNEMVQVAIRCRPMSEKEVANDCVKVVKIESLNNIVKIYDTKQENIANVKVFTYDATFDETCSQCEIYNKMVRPLVEAVLNGYNGTVFAYGQSGSGKTYTMEGIASDSKKGIIPRTFENIFDHISRSCDIQYLVHASYMEIYQDEIRDLLDVKKGKKYELKESKNNGVYVKGISSFVCKSGQEMNSIIEAGRRNRTTASTEMNERSSRSHAILIITVEMKDLTGLLEGRVRVGKLNLVDLAGSERQNKTNAEGERLKEANKINLSLSALGNVISALSENKSHYIPYRDSKLTRILKDSLGGNSKTLMIANVGPASYNYKESLNTLRYASRAKNIRNVPKVNEDPVDTLIKRYQDEIKRLKCQLAERTASKKSRKTEILEVPPLDESANKESLSVLQEHSSTSSDTYFVGIGLLENVNSNINETEQQNEDELRKRILLMESRLLIGGKSILEHTAEQKKTLEEHEYKLNRIKEREKHTRESLEKEKEISEEIKGVYRNLQHEVEIKKQTLAKFPLKLQSTLQKINDAKDEFNADRRELEIAQQELLKEIKLKLMIMENFIPKERRRQIFPRIYYNENMDCWQLKPNSELPQVHPQPKRVEHVQKPLTLRTAFTFRKNIHVYRRDQIEEGRQRNLRFRGKDKLELDLIHSNRITKDYKQPKLSSTLNSIMQTALQREVDIDIDASCSSLSARSYVNPPRRSFESISNKSEANPRKTQSAINFPVYPKARGLVPK